MTEVFLLAIAGVLVLVTAVGIWGLNRLELRIAALEDESDRRAAAEYAEDPRIPRTF